jgi:hypothetical protein
MAEYRYYLIPDAMTRAFPEQFGKQTPTEFFDNIADLEKRYHQLREMPYNNERTWNERARFPYARLVVGVDRQNPDGEVSVIQVRNGINYLCDDYRGPYADGSDAQIPQMAKKLVEVIGVDRVRPHTYTQRDGYTWVQVEKNMHITEWLYAHELCNSLQFTRFLNRDGRELFQVRDGQRVIETNADGTKRIRAVKSIDVTHDVYDLELYESNGLAAVEPNALSGKYAFLSACVVGDAENRYQFSCEQNELSTETGADFHLTVTDTASPDREMNTPSRDQNSTVQAANSFNNRNTDAPQQSTTQPEIVSQPVKQQEKQLDLLSLLLDFMPVVLVGAVLFAVRRKRRH